MAEESDDDEELVMGDDTKYEDANGNPVTLDELCRLEPAWAANRIRAEKARVSELGVRAVRAERLCAVVRAEVAENRALSWYVRDAVIAAIDKRMDGT